jgi:[lysine-biosynthesis-protein LysW]--L-2-aminoadipate ligase
MPTENARNPTMRDMRVGIVAHYASETNLGLASAAPLGFPASVLGPDEALRQLEPGMAALGRLDVLDTLDGVEPGLRELERMAAHGIVVLNPATALRLSHDKLATASALRAADIAHPRTCSVTGLEAPLLPFPLVVKPRYGSWGRDVLLCSDKRDYDDALRTLSSRPWFRRTGAVAQELVPPLGHDLRMLIACGEIVGAVKRVAAPGEWRTNVALGASRVPVDPSPAACRLALAAAAAVGADLVGVDLLPLGPGRFVVLEVNGAVDFSADYEPHGDVFSTAMRAITCRLTRLEHEPLTAVA